MIIGLNGKIGAGKDTVADFLVAEYGFTKVGYSDVMYDAVCALWGITLEEALRFKDTDPTTTVQLQAEWYDANAYTFQTWREFLQRFGTEMGRDVFGGDFWVAQFNQKYLDELGDDEFEALRYIVRDVRFDNEAQNIIDFGGEIWQIQRPGYEADGHVSESGIDEGWIKGDICNDGTIDELYVVLDEWMARVYGLNPV